MLDPVANKKQGGESPLKKIRSVLDVTQEEFAQMLGVSVFTVSRWERGTREAAFTLAQIQLLQSALEEHGLSLSSFPLESSTEAQN